MNLAGLTDGLEVLLETPFSTFVEGKGWHCRRVPKQEGTPRRKPRVLASSEKPGLTSELHLNEERPQGGGLSS